MIPWSISNLDSTATIESRFHDFGILDALISLPLYVAIHETSIWSLINDPDLISIQRLRLNRDFTYVNIGIPDVNNL
jgi:hypothetical protein